MKTKKTIVVLVGTVLILSIILIVFAINIVHLADTTVNTENEKDRLIGVLITTEYLDLFDRERHLNDTDKQVLNSGEVSMDDSSAHQGRIYATLNDDPYSNEETNETHMGKRYVFDEIDGIAYFCAMYKDDMGNSYQGDSGDNAITDGAMGISVTDEGESISLEGTIYVSTTNGSSHFYYNPVYQNANGEVYVMSGNGMSYGGEVTAGMSGSQNPVNYLQPKVRMKRA